MTDTHPSGPLSHTPAYAPVDLSTCDREPIHVPGAIQPHGVLLAMDDDGGVVVASANCAQLLGVACEAAIGLAAEDLLGPEVAALVGERAHGDRGEPLTVRLPVAPADPEGDGTLRGRYVDIAVHRSGDRVVAELEELADSRTAPSFQSVRGTMARLVGATTVASLADRLAAEIRGVTGFDRAMVYRFDADWNGEVVAEARREDLNPFLGLHYPATDIPAQARRLYTVNWIRLIADISYRPVPLQPLHDPGTGAPLDLSFSTLRSVSPIHVEYLSNMGVTASMSVSLVVDGQLWGLIACHHYSGPHRPSHDARAAAEMIGQTASQLLAERERSDLREDALRAQATLAGLAASLARPDADILGALVEEPTVRDLLSATGIARCYDDVVATGGAVPPEAAIRRIAALLRGEDGEARSSAHLADLDPELAAYADVAAGAMIVGTAADRWVIWFRPELERVVDWGGDPSNAKLYEREGPNVRLSPRKSFDKWREVVRGHSRPWTGWQHDIANSVRTHVAGLMLHRSREQVAVAESLQRTVVADMARTVAGLDVAATYLPATEFQLGGDWWDALQLADGRVAFAIGDVAGHGVSAVAAMTQIRTALRTLLFAGHRAAESLDQLDLMMDELMEDQIASAAVLVLDPRTGDFELVNAGHLPPILYDEGRGRLVEGTHRPLLGIGLGTARTVTGNLGPGATLLLFTDGLIERRGQDLVLSLDQLRETGEPGPLDSPDAAAMWVASLVESVPGMRDDDTTVLAIRRTG
ncbi:GAF domain-containing protein [Nocardioides sp. GY 10113]|uniref:SpoIIE family protein phosphatase n=1 Tax=Nocardioides sp. GY 10113 TaxID=2569761 RepID=UPI0010A8BC27|nr:SpoIIE family protein phosphatase [Nocardioides sp. GY 10113]TIC83568.1 GAF domain-containing protein [Nocardioides sp. GY 10113]